jgi:hypothetical protein
MFRVNVESVMQESGEDIIAFRGGQGRLALLADYLYGDEATALDFSTLHQDIRLSPSIIVRSESELLGISSPRFAFRAYLGNFGFVTIRRRRCTHDRILDLHGKEEYIYDLIPRSGRGSDVAEVLREWTEEDADNNNWIADSLLAIPRRWTTDSWRVITCNLSRDFGEDYSDSLVPFVTHVQFGGGLCAQAACFMVLCLLEHSKILGISEITYEAARWVQGASPSDELVPAATSDQRVNPVQNLLRIRGLTPTQIKGFFDVQSNLSAQQQFQSITDPNGKAKICRALRVYVKNNIPVIQIVSLARMLGHGVEAPAPILTLADHVDHTNYNQIPMGVRRGIDLSEDASHCVVIIGCSDTQFLINDPATFPFIPCTDVQIVNICPPRGRDDEESEQSLPRDKSVNRDHAADVDAWRRDVRLKRLAEKSDIPSVPKPDEQLPNLFQAISVTPVGVVLPLLHIGKQEDGRSTSARSQSWAEHSGLFAMIDDELQSGECSGLLDFHTVRGRSISPSCSGELYLVHVRKGDAGRSEDMLLSPHPKWGEVRCDPKLAVPNLSSGVYWVHHTRVKAVSKSNGVTDVQAIFFWDASQRSIRVRTCLSAVFIGRSGDWVFHALRERQG